jgi:cysteine-rich repeat protein
MTIRRSPVFLFTLTALVAASCVEPAPPEQAIGQRDSARSLTDRTRLAATGQYLLSRPPRAFAATPAQGQALVNALDVPAELQPTFVSLVTPDQDLAVAEATFVRPSYGILRPTGNPATDVSFLVLSTGRSGNAQIAAEPGTDFAPSGPDGDVAALQLQVTVPAGVNRMSFDYNFLSAESPDFIGSQFNDTFTATISDRLGANRVVVTASVNAAAFHPAADTTVGPCPFQLYVDNPAGVNTLFNQPGFTEVDAGATGFQRVDVAVASGPATITFDIRDLGDGVFDSAVIIDNLRFSAVELVDPQAGLLDTFRGQVIRTSTASNLERLAAVGTPVAAAVADGVTQVLLRSNVSGPGAAVFSVASGAATDGAVSGNDTAPVWSATAPPTDAQLIGGKWFVFALYRSPPDFNRGPDTTDATSARRTAGLSMTFTPSGGVAEPRHDIAIDLVRPPVVVIPEIWGKCTLDGIMSPQPSDLSLQHFTVSCADNSTISSRSFEDGDNRATLDEVIRDALQKLRGARVAATRADVIGHGMGGLLARRYIDDASYLRFDNFNAGGINRLITMSTPHLGSRLADEFVRTRDTIKQNDLEKGIRSWPNTKLTLANAGIRFDDADQDLALQEMGSNSSIIKSISAASARPASVFFHAIATTGGHDLLRGAISNNRLLPVAIKNFLIVMENNHPSSAKLPPGPNGKQKLVYGPIDPKISIIFCSNTPTPDADQHDLFATMAEQLGGLDPQFTTTLTIDNTVDSNSAHFRVASNRPHTDRLVELLNAPVHGGLYATAMPSPGTIPSSNGCPILPPLVSTSTSRSPVARAFAQPTITIAAPIAGTTVASGQTLSVTVDTGTGVQPESVLITSEASSEVVEAPPFTTHVVIPADAVGTTTVSAIAFYGDGDMAFTETVALRVELAATVTKIEVINGDQVLRRPGRTRQLTVLGTFSDGIRRDITQGAVGTRYTVSQLSSIATVSAGGLLTAVGPGDATLSVSSGAAITSVNVKVGDPGCGDGVLDPGEECDDGNVRDGDGCDPTCHSENAPPVAVCTSPTLCNDLGLCSATITNLGAGSFDPNGDAVTVTQSPAGPYPVGTQPVAVAVSDGALEAQCASQVDVLDCEPPRLSCPADFAAECAAAGAATITPPAVTASDNCSVNVLAPGGGSLSLGSHELAYTASDPSGNTARCATTVTVRDTAPPVVTCPAATVAECTGGRRATVDPGLGSASDTCTSAAVTNPGPAVFALGTTTLQYTASDLSGNHSTCDTTVTVRDTAAPLITCPAPTVAECTGNGHAVVDPGNASASDLCTTAAASRVGATAFALGQTPVPYIAVDEAGNQASCTTTVMVQDTLPPSIACPRPVVAECERDARAFVTPALAQSSDLCTDVAVTGPPAGPFPLGTTVVTYTSSDLTGHQASCHTTIEVVDTTPPRVVAERTVVLRPANHRYRTVNLADCAIEVGDTCDGRFALARPAITCVTSDEPDDTPGGGDGHTRHDIVLINDSTVKLRAERDAHSDGRVYKIHFRARDRSGNPRDGVCSVVVPRHGCDDRHQGDHDDDRHHDHGHRDRAYHDHRDDALHEPHRTCRVGDGSVASSVCVR